MDFKLVKSLVDWMIQTKTRLSNLDPFFRGESLLHPQFAEIIDYIREKSKQNFPLFEFMVLHTNGELLNERNAEAILRFDDQTVFKHPGNLFFSIDAATKQTYDIVRPGGDFNKVVNNIKNFVMLREQKHQYGPSIVFQFIIQKQNRHEAKAFLNYWSNFLKSEGIEFSVDRSLGADIGEVKRTNIFFRRLQHSMKYIKENIEMQREVMEDLGLVGK